MLRDYIDCKRFLNIGEQEFEVIESFCITYKAIVDISTFKAVSSLWARLCDGHGLTLINRT